MHMCTAMRGSLHLCKGEQGPLQAEVCISSITALRAVIRKLSAFCCQVECCHYWVVELQQA